MSQTSRQDTDIGINRLDIKSHETRIDKTELNQATIKATTDNINSALVRIEAGVAEQGKAQQKMIIEVTKTSTKVEQLTKD